jgi:peptidoglycan/LPS O-acetylase OafA/YrhL
MNTGPSIFSRYQEARTRVFLENEKTYANWLPGLRPQKRRRAFVAFLLVLLAASAGFALSEPVFDWAIGTWGICYIVFTFAAIVLGIVSNRRAEAPVDALDELEVQLRNEARSIGLTVTQALGTAAAAYLFLGSIFGATNFGISGGALMLTALSAGGATPAMLLAWTTPDYDPEDG